MPLSQQLIKLHKYQSHIPHSLTVRATTHIAISSLQCYLHLYSFTRVPHTTLTARHCTHKLSESKEGAKEGKGKGDAKPEAKEGEESGEGDGT